MFGADVRLLVSEPNEELKRREPGETTMPPNLRAANSWGERGRDFRRSFCRLFWNQIWLSSVPIEREYVVQTRVGADSCIESTDLHLLLAERNALNDIETRHLVGFWVIAVCVFEDFLVL